MGTALGFAVTQPAIIALAVFAALGAGMAAPLLLLSYSQLARKLMPKPGRWMESLKQFLAFPLYAAGLALESRREVQGHRQHHPSPTKLYGGVSFV